jgi:nitroreductase/NAD-dependent dihydropyrimidine dehydrogenase PreA subunit
MNFLHIDEETCTRCGICATVCAGGLIRFREGGFPRPLSAIDAFCLRCGHCIGICPANSITHDELPAGECLPIEESRQVSLDQCAQLIKSRRSVRFYKDRPVPRDEIVRLIDIARYAPTGHNEQGVRWLVIDDAATIRRIEAIGHDWMRDRIAEDARMAEMFTGVLKRMEAGHPDFIRNAPALVVAHAGQEGPTPGIDCAIALGYFDLAANAAGLGCCWAGFFMMAANTYPALKELLALPDGQRVHGALMLGYPKYARQRIPPRRPARVTWV